MTDIRKELGVQSWCFRHFKKNEEVIEKVKACGLSRIELSGAHADFKDESKFAAVVDLYRKSGVQIVSIGVQGMANQEDVERKYFEFVKAAGAKFMSVSFSIGAMQDCLRTAEKLADKYDVRLAIHNHGGRHWLGNAETLRHIFSKTNPRIGLCLDTAWALDSGEDPIKMVETFRDRLYGLHIKDFVFDKARKPKDVVVGKGNLKLKELLQKAAEVKFDGYVALEYEGDVENPVPAVKKCVQAVMKEE